MRHLAFILGFSLAAAPAFAAETTYIGVVDAGSSASRMYVYKVPAGEQTVEDVFEISTTTTPLSAHAAHPDAAGEKAIAPLLGSLDTVLAEHGVSKADLEIHVLATGGMRLLPAPEARAIEDSVRRSIAEGGYKPGRVETISGEAEGFYAWVDVNMLLGRLGPGRRTAGIVEIGGASMQAAYAGAPASAPGVVTATLGGETYSVRSISFLGLGVEQARKALAAGPDAGACYPEGLVSDTPDLSKLRGAFDPARCAAAFADIVAGPSRALPRDEIRDLDFVGLGRPLNGVLADWRLAQDKPAAIKNMADEKCVLPWPTFARAFGATPYTQYLCANSIYLSTLLFAAAGFGISPDRVVAAETIAGRRPSWTRGAALMLRD